LYSLFVAVDIVLRDLLPKSTYFRCNPNMSEEVAMDECRAEMLEQVQVDTKVYIEKNKQTLQEAVHALLRPRTFTQRVQDKWSKWTDENE